MNTSLQEAQARLRSFGQEHLLRFFHELDGSAQERLLRQVLAIDYPLLSRLHRELVQSPPTAESLGRLEPLAAESFESLPLPERAALTTAGMRALREGKVAAFLVAGGQGTRLGHAGPKGTFSIGLPSGKSLFQLQAERLLALSRRAGKAIPWYIMTSPENHAETVAFFSERGFFGFPERDLLFFPQGELPVVDAEGRILLADKGRVSLGPNGNGGCFLALKQSGALDDMKKRGVEWVFIYSVDNALVKVADPRFVGYALQSGFPAASKAVVKAGPDEKVGVLCRRNGRPSVIEYSDLPASLRESRLPDGSLEFRAGNIAIHLFSRAFLAANAEEGLPYHVAHKKIPFVDESGKTVTPATPNAFKFELFMFDLFPRAEGMAALLVEREEEFAPVKNADGVDSPESARTLLRAQHRKWLLAAGLPASSLEGRLFEISPLTSLEGEDLPIVDLRAKIAAGEGPLLI